MGNILNTLEGLGLASKKTSHVFSPRTRDKDSLHVMRDSVSGVIYIDDFYVGEDEYASGSYREEVLYEHESPDFEDIIDTERRLSSYKKYYTGLNVCDVGCGAGQFLQGANKIARSVAGVELQNNYLQHLNSNKIPCYNNIQDHNKEFDVVFSFHALEHFDSPVLVLKSIYDKIAEGGKVIIEVPHANDFLISILECKSFIDFTLWSQHLILHTRDSLKRFLLAAGFTNIIIEGVQRYPLSNHLTWLSKCKPGGHKSNLALLDEPELHNAYGNVLRKIDATDTLVAIASKKN